MKIMVEKGLRFGILSIFISVLTLSKSIAQDNSLLPLENTFWSTHYYHIGEQIFWLPYHTTTFHFEGDTLIDGISYNKLYANTDTIDTGHQLLEVDEYRGAFHQTSDHVTFISKGELEIDTLYDYRLSIGDTMAMISQLPDVECPAWEDCVAIRLVSIDSIVLVDGQLRKRFNFGVFEGENSLGHSHSWIEGVGSTLGLLNDPTDVLRLHYDSQSAHPWRQLLCFESNGEILYVGDQFNGTCNRIRGRVVSTQDLELAQFKIYPNPCSSTLVIEDSKRNAQAYFKLMNLGGAILQSGKINTRSGTEIQLSGLQTGLYILGIENKGDIYYERIIKL